MEAEWNHNSKSDRVADGRCMKIEPAETTIHLLWRP